MSRRHLASAKSSGFFILCTEHSRLTLIFEIENTVKTHQKNNFGKLGVEDRTHAVLAAVYQDIVHLE
ncbi:MAG TPA: hypothetical protein VNX46_01295 [Candidatus Acidoferrum sp.]|nr:hypothetical protein [Candidatus Acidoferrum sp.]